MDLQPVLSAGFGAAQGGALSGAPLSQSAPTDTFDFNASNLYGPSGSPSELDIDQDSISDCYFLASLGAQAQVQPERLQNQIHFDEQTGIFNVTMFRNGKEVSVPVTQAEVRGNVIRGGGSRLDNVADMKAPCWPAVMETAYAKMNDGNWSDGLSEGYAKIDKPTFAREGLAAITGDKGTDLNAFNVPGFRNGSVISETPRENLMLAHLNQALSERRSVTLTTNPEQLGQDGLSDNHVYIVDSVFKDANGTVKVDLRNPYNDNLNVGEGKDTANACVTVELKTLIETWGLEHFNIAGK